MQTIFGADLLINMIDSPNIIFFFLFIYLFFLVCVCVLCRNNRAEYTIQKQKDDILYAALIMKRKERMELEERVKELKAEKGAEDSDVDVTVLKNHNVFNPSD